MFVGLKEGTLELLVESEDSLPASITDPVFPQMLQALDFLAYNGIIHRDVKPANILYVSQLDSQYQFQLGDFGFCNRAINAASNVGTPIYMAPEMFHRGVQTSKADVWSLFVTMLWTLNIGEFRQSRFDFFDDIRAAVVFRASKMGIVSKMAVVDPETRASVAQMLVNCCGGAGLTTPRDQVLALTSTPSAAIPADGTPAPVRPAPAARTAQSRSKVQKNGNIFTAATQNRVEKAPSTSKAQHTRRLQELRGKPQMTYQFYERRRLPEVRVNSLSPRVYPSDMSTAFLAREEISKMVIPAGRAGTAEDIAGTILFLCSRGGAYFNGNIIISDGGWLAVVPGTY